MWCDLIAYGEQIWNNFLNKIIFLKIKNVVGRKKEMIELKAVTNIRNWNEVSHCILPMWNG